VGFATVATELVIFRTETRLRTRSNFFKEATVTTTINKKMSKGSSSKKEQRAQGTTKRNKGASRQKGEKKAKSPKQETKSAFLREGGEIRLSLFLLRSIQSSKNKKRRLVGVRTSAARRSFLQKKSIIIDSTELPHCFEQLHSISDYSSLSGCVSVCSFRSFLCLVACARARERERFCY
jgi:hypothetical protein